MYLRILLNRNIPLKKRIKNALLYMYIRRNASASWKVRFRKTKQLNPALFKKLEASVELKHKMYWSYFRRRVNMKTLRVSSNLSHVSDSKYFPEEIFVSDIEPTLNNVPLAKIFEVKNFYTLWFGQQAKFPNVYVNKINNDYFDQNLNKLSSKKLDELVTTIDTRNVVIKPSKDSDGGKNVYIAPKISQIKDLLNTFPNMVLQERVQLDPDYCSIAGGKPVSNRIYMYRSVSDDKWHFINSVFRMAVGNTIDNVSGGAIVTLVKENGAMNGFAVDKYGQRLYAHPETKLPFDQTLPKYDQLKELARFVCQKIPYVRVVGLDALFDEHQNWRMIEVNLFSTSIRLAQYHGYPFMGDFTDEVVEYCKKNHWAFY
jgi:hypothetical protein